MKRNKFSPTLPFGSAAIIPILDVVSDTCRFIIVSHLLCESFNNTLQKLSCEGGSVADPSFFFQGEFSWWQSFPSGLFWGYKTFCRDSRKFSWCPRWLTKWIMGNYLLSINEAPRIWICTPPPSYHIVQGSFSRLYLVIQTIQSLTFMVSSLPSPHKIPSATYKVKQNIHINIKLVWIIRSI